MAARRTTADRVTDLRAPLSRRLGLAVLCGSLGALVGGCRGDATPDLGPPPAEVDAAPIDYVPTPPASQPTEPQTTRRLRRLSNDEIETVLADLLGTRLEVTKGFLPDRHAEGYDNDVVALGISDSKIDELDSAAERAAAFVATGPNLERLAPCAATEAPPDCARRFALGFATNAWGRPPSDDELLRLGAVFGVGAEGGPYAGGIGLVVEAIIASPHFLFRSELGEDATAGTQVQLGGFEIASQLSFLLRGSRPDSALLAAAAAGELGRPEAREREARRLLGSEGSRRHVRRFLRAWLGLGRVAMINKDLAVFPEFTPTLRRALDRELETFLSHVLESAGGRLDELLLADYTFPSPALAPLYGPDLLDRPGDFTKVRLHPRRRGLLSSPAFLATHALVNQTNPVDRGLLVRTRLFCEDVPPPPADVVTQTPTGPAEQTTRQKYEAHARDPRCEPCHRLMDPLGFGFEQFDSLGRFRTSEGGHPIDARGAIHDTDVDGAFTGPAELAARLQKSAMFRRCFVQQLWRFAEGRAVTRRDQPEIDALASAFEAADHRIDDLLLALVKRPTFILRKAGKEAP